MADDGGGNIKVVVRCRPLNSREIARGAKPLIRMQGNQTILEPPDANATGANARGAGKGTMNFSFDKSYWSAGPKDEPGYCSQQMLFDDLGNELLNHAFGGFNACIFAYGQTGSGKSYSMMGYGAEKGIIPLTCHELFVRLDARTASDANLSYTVEVSFIEIYNEKVRDLLNPKNTGNLRVREHPSLGPYVEDLSKLAVKTHEEVITLMDEGNKARTVAATNMNETSSRSHSVFTLTLTMKRHDTDTNLDTEKVSRINLVDLAGSERANSTGATGQRLKEGANINKSLTTLGKVISSLALASNAPAKGKKNAADFTPYRDSVLTWLLKDSLGGNSKTAMIAAISPADYEETLSTLRYADQAKKIKNKAVINEDPNAKLVRELKEELEMLRARVGGAASEATFDPTVPPEKQKVTYQTKTGEIKTVTKAELVDQLQSSEKLMQSLNETWEQKLERTQEVQKEREQALEELGITVEKNNVGVHTPKKAPHLVNLNEDPLMSECLIYQLKDGRTTVGGMETEKVVQIKLSGESILDEHCYFENKDGKVTLHALPNAKTFLNGRQISPDETCKLRSGYRVILGDHHVFRFNNPEEVRKQRKRATMKSSLHTSITAEEIEAMKAEGADRPPSPATSEEDDKDVDWTYAKREAALAKLGLDPAIDSLRDEDLNKLYERVTMVKSMRDLSARPRPESSLSLSQQDDVWSENGRNPFGTDALTDDTSVDAGGASPDAALDAQASLEDKTREVESRLHAIAESSAEAEDLKEEKEQMEHQLRLVQAHMKRLIDARARGEPEGADDAFEPVLYSARHLRLIRRVLDKWRAHRAFSMAETVLSNAALLKEANVLARELRKEVSYNFTIASGGALAAPASSVTAIAGLDDFADVADPVLASATQPAVAVKVLDYAHRAIYVWSLDRLQQQVQRMRNLTAFIDRPAYSLHFSADEPFYNVPAPEYSFVGNALVALAPLARRLSSTTTVPIFDRYTAEAIGSCRVDIKLVSVVTPTPKGPGASTAGSAASTRAGTPSTNEPKMLPVGSKVSFFLTVDAVKGLAPHDFASAHLQTRLSAFVGSSLKAEEMYASNTVDLARAPPSDLKFRRAFSLVVTSKVLQHLRTGYAPIELFAVLKPQYLERMERWDELREQKVSFPQRSGSPSTNGAPSEDAVLSPAVSYSAVSSSAASTSSGTTGAQPQPTMRRSENDFVMEQSHDVVAYLQVRELAPDGSYAPVPLLTQGNLDPGAFSLHQGLQRRLSLTLTSNSGKQLPWTDVVRVRVGNIRLLDVKGRVHESSSRPLITLPLLAEQTLEFRPDGSALLEATALWDSSVHDSALLNRVTGAGQRVLLQITWSVAVENCAEPVQFSMDMAVAMQTRDARPPSKIVALLSSTRILQKSSSVFRVRLSPPLTRSAKELWRLDTSEKYVRGEEVLSTWRPRGLSVVEDYGRLVTMERRAADVQAVRVVLAHSPAGQAQLSAEAQQWAREGVLTKALTLWQKRFGAVGEIVLSQEPATPTTPAEPATPPRSARPRREPREEPMQLVASTKLMPRSNVPTKSGHLNILLDATNDVWERRWFVLRRPYLHVYKHSNELEEISVISLDGVNVEYNPDLVSLYGRPFTFTLFTSSNSHALAAPSLKELQSWTSKLDPTRLPS